MGKSIEEIKKEMHLHSSEIVLDIMPEPENTFPMVYSIIGDIKSVSRDLENAINEEDFSDVANAMSALSWVLDELEDVRNSIEDIQAWGQDWKDLAKRLFEAMPEELQEEFY